MNPRANDHASKHRPRGFESLEPRYALDGTLPQLPSGLCPSPPVVGMVVYAAPIGPAPVSSMSAIAARTSLASMLPAITAEYIQQVKIAATPIGPARPATLPTPLPSVAVPPPQAPPVPLYAEGVLPTNQTPANLPTTQQSLPMVNDPPSQPTFRLFSSRPLF